MTKVKLILAGITGAIGLTGAALVPSLLKSSGEPTFEKEVESGPKAVAKAWSKGTVKDTSFNSFGDAFAPFLLDINGTNDEAWEQKYQQHKSTSSGWDKITDKATQVSEIKNACISFYGKKSGDADLERMMNLCGIYDFKGKNLNFGTQEGKSSVDLSGLTAGKVCEILVGDSNIVQGACAKIEATLTSAVGS